MSRILIIGARKSTAVLIDHLLEQAASHDWKVHVVGRDIELARARVGDHACGEAGELDVDDGDTRDRMIQNSALVVSMLPAHMHAPVAVRPIPLDSASLNPPESGFALT